MPKQSFEMKVCNLFADNGIQVTSIEYKADKSRYVVEVCE